MNENKLSDSLLQNENGIWYTDSNPVVSYPVDGNITCFEVEDDSYWFEHRNNLVSDLLRKYTQQYDGAIPRFLDVGGGNGVVSSRLIQEGFDVVLLEPGRSGALNAKLKRFIPNVICATLQEARIKTAVFDAVGAFDVIEHIEDDASFISEIARTIKSGGLFIATVPACDILWSNEDIHTGHYRRYTPKMLQELLTPWFETIYTTFFFAPLFIPVLLFRALPINIPGLKNGLHLSLKQEHGTNNGLLVRMLRSRLNRERKKINKGQKILFGTSCCIVGVRRSE